MHKIYWIETLSCHKMYYAVESKNPPSLDVLNKRINEATLEEIAQEWQGEKVTSVTEVSKERYKELWNERYPSNHPYHELFSENKIVAMDNLINNLEDEIQYTDDKS